MPQDHAVASVERRQGHRLFAAALVLILVVASISVIYFVSVFELSIEEVVTTLHAWGPWAVVAAILLMIIHSFIPFPAELIAIANCMVFGPYWGFVITWSGAMLGAALAFGLARWFGRPFVAAALSSRQLAAVDRWAGAQETSALLVVRLIPIISFNLVNFAAGLLAIQWPKFLWTTAVGIVPFTALMTLLGERLTKYSGANEWLLIFGIVVIAVYSLWLWRARKRGDSA